MSESTTALYIEKLPERFSIKHKITEHPKHTFHRHHEFEMIFALSDMVCHFENGRENIPKYSMILLNPSELHCLSTDSPSGLCDRYVLYFSQKFISDFSTAQVNLLECFMLRADRRPVVLSVPNEMQTELLSMMKKMEALHLAEKEGTSKIYGASLQLRFLLGELLLETNRLFFEQFHLRAAPTSLGHTQLVFDIAEYIRNHYREQLTAGSVANTFFISKTQLYNIFKEITGLTVSDYITEYRIAQAKNLLINSDYSIEMISGAVGYATLSSFSRAFKTVAKTSPLAYRKKMRYEQ